MFAALAPAPGAKANGSTVLAWRAAAEGAASLAKQASQLHLPAPVHSLHALQPLPLAKRRRGGAAAAQQQQQQDGAATMDVDASSSQQPAIAAVYRSGALALCTDSEVVAEAASPAAAGMHTLAASLDADSGLLTVVHWDNASGAASVAAAATLGGQLRAGAAVPLAPPHSDAGRAVAAASVSGRTAVLWSDGNLAIYRSPSSSGGRNGGASEPALPLLSRRLRGLRLDAPKAGREAKTPAKGGKKRGKGGAEEGPAEQAAGAALAALDGGLLAVVGWSTEGPPGGRVGREGRKCSRLLLLGPGSAQGAQQPLYARRAVMNTVS